MSNEKWNQFKQEKIEIKKPDNLSQHIFELVPKMLSLNPLNRPNATDILPSMSF